MNALTGRTAKIIFGIPFIIFGAFHFMNAGQLAGMVPIPPQTLWVYVTGACLIAAGLAIVANKMARLASLLLALLLVVFILGVHLPGVIGGNQMAVAGLLKDLALVGGALVIAGTSND